MSELDRFKRRLVRSVSRLLLRERRDPEEVWETLRKGTGKDCKELWMRMRTLTIKKLSRLLAANDQPSRVPAVARMTSTDWLVVDLALVHEDVDVIDLNDKLDKHGDKNSPLWALLRLAMTFNVDALSGVRLAAVWVSLAKNYNSCGRECSPMLLQKRWYQLKEAARNKFYYFWQAWHGDVRQIAAAREFAPTKVLAVVAKCNPNIITQEFLKWEELKQHERVVSVELMQAVLKNAKKAQKPPAEADNEPDVVMMEPKITTIDLDAESDGENTKKSGNESVDSTHKEGTSTSQDKEITPLVKVKTEPEEKHYEGEDGLANIQIVQATHVPTEDLEGIDKDDDNNTPKVVLKTELDENITLTETVVSKATELDEVETKIEIEDIAFHKEIIETNIMLDHSDNEDDIIMYDSTVNTNATEGNNEKNHKSLSKDQTDTALEGKEKAAENEDKPEGISAAELEFVDDGIEMTEDADEGEYLGVNDENNETIEANSSHNTSDGVENMGKIDLKLIMKPVVYTTKLDHMTAMRDKPIDNVASEELIRVILEESKPVTTKMEIQLESETPIAPLNNEDKHISNDIIKFQVPQESVTESVSVDPSNDRLDESGSIKNNKSDEESSDDEVERLSIDKSMFRKPKVSEYSPILLCKNPDFNTRLKRLNMMFYAYEQNRRFLKSCKPMTIDLSKCFESKLQNNTIYLKRDLNTKIKEEIKQELFNNTENHNIEPTSHPVESPTKNITHSHAKLTSTAHSPIPMETSDIKLDDPTIEVDQKPVLNKISPYNNSTGNLSVKCIPSDNPNIKYLEVALNTEHNKVENEINPTHAKLSSSDCDVVASNIESNTNLLSGNITNNTSAPISVHNATEPVIIEDAPETSTGARSQPAKKGIAKKKTTPKSLWYHLWYKKPSLPPWASGKKKPVSQMPPGSLLTLDALNKMLNICLEAEGAPPAPPIAKTKGKTKKNYPKQKIELPSTKYCCWIKEFYRTKQFGKLRAHPCISSDKGCTCCCRRNYGNDEKPGDKNDNETESADYDKTTDLTLDDETVGDAGTSEKSKKKVARKRKSKVVKDNSTGNDDDTTEIDVTTVTEPEPPTPAITTRIVTPPAPNEGLNDGKFNVNKMNVKNNVEIADQNPVASPVVIKPLQVLQSVEKPAQTVLEILVQTPIQSPDEITQLIKTYSKKNCLGPPPLSKLSEPTEPSDCIVLSDDENDDEFYLRAKPEKRPRGRPRKNVQNTITGLINKRANSAPKLLPGRNNSRNLQYLKEFSKQSPFNVGRNRILLTTAKVPQEMYKIEKQQEASPPKIPTATEAPLVELPRGIKFAVAQNGKLSCFVDFKIYDSNKILELATLVEKVRKQLKFVTIPVIVTNADNKGISSTETHQNIDEEKNAEVEKLLSDNNIIELDNDNITEYVKTINEETNNINTEKALNGYSMSEKDKYVENTSSDTNTVDLENESVNENVEKINEDTNHIDTEKGVECYSMSENRNGKKTSDTNLVDLENDNNIRNVETEESNIDFEKQIDVANVPQKEKDVEKTKCDEETNLVTTENDNIYHSEKDSDLNPKIPDVDKGTENPIAEQDSTKSSENINQHNQENTLEIDADTGETRISTDREKSDSLIEENKADIVETNKEVTSPNKSQSEPILSSKPFIKIKDFAAVVEEPLVPKKTILSDLMEMSGISADDTLPEQAPAAPTSPVFFHVQDVTQTENSDVSMFVPALEKCPEKVVPTIDEVTSNIVFQTVEGTLQLTPVTSIEILKYARVQNAQFFRLDLITGTIVSTEVTIIQKNKTKLGRTKDAVLVDLTQPNKEVVEVHSHSETGVNKRQSHILVPTAELANIRRKPSIFRQIATNRRESHKKYLNRLRSLLKTNNDNPAGEQKQFRTCVKKYRKQKVEARIDMVDSDTPMEEEFLDESSEEERLSLLKPKAAFSNYKNSIVNRAHKAIGATPKAISITTQKTIYQAPKPDEKAPVTKESSDSDDSDDEPLAKKVMRKVEEPSQNMECDEVENPDEDMNSSFSIEGLIDEIMSDEEEEILGS